MRYDVKKFLFVGVNSEREAFFTKAQEMGLVHFVKIGPAPVKEVPEDVQNIVRAIKVLRGLPSVEQEEDLEEYTLGDGFVHKILDLKDTLERLAEDERIAKLEISRVEPFGDFPMEDLVDLEKETGRKIQFYCAKEGIADHIELPESFLCVATEHGLDYFMALNKELTQIPRMVEIIVDRPVGVWRKQLLAIQEGSHKAEQRLKTYAKYNTFLHHALIYKLNTHHLQAAVEGVNNELEGTLFAVEGWVPVNKVFQLHPLVDKMNVHVEEIAFDPHDVPPTYLENHGVERVGEDLVHIYDTPSNTDKDPSLWVLIFFALFFAFIVGDGGYGLIFLLVALYVRSKYELKNTGQRIIKLLTILGFATLCWGFLTTSFFGINFDIDSPLRKVSIVNWMAEKKAAYLIQTHNEDWHYWVKKFPQLETVKDPHEFIKTGIVEKEGSPSYEILNRFSDNIMFELAILIGIVHIILSLLRYLDRNYGNIGWILFLIGAYLYFPYFLRADSIIYFVFGVDPERGAQNGLYLMAGGVSFATIIAIFKHKWTGILEPMNVIQLFADSMSYLRLYALGLSGAMLTATMNDLAGSVNFVLAALIIVCGHIVNIVLCIMGGTIHGLRLNFLEWYHYSFEGGGKPFNPLRKLPID